MTEKHTSYTAKDPVYGETGHHTTETGAKGESLLHNVKEVIPGTKEHRETHGTTRAGEGGYTGTGMMGTTCTGYGTTGTEYGTTRTTTGTKGGGVMHDVEKHILTQDYEATHPAARQPHH